MKTGLRTEIVISVSLLLAAALLFAGFLLVKLTEQELLEQRRSASFDTVRQVVAMLEASFAQGHSDAWKDEAAVLFQAFRHRSDLAGWRFVDAAGVTLFSMLSGEQESFSELPVSRLLSGEIVESVTYSSSWFTGEVPTSNRLDLVAPVTRGGDFVGAFQARFSLSPLVERVHKAQRLIFICVIGYGLVLAFFGVYQLSRNVVQPVRRLQSATADVASGSLARVDVTGGPGEITDLAESFNQMVDALGTSRDETEAHIESLTEANRALARARDDLVRSEKMASVGHLAAGMAHEIGNPLGALFGYLDMLGSDLPGEAERDLVRRARDEAGRIDTLVRELLDYAAPETQPGALCCPVNLLRETVTLLSHQGAISRLKVEDRLREPAGKVRIGPQRLQQVWVNLILNARDAMENEGRLTLSSGESGGMLTISLTDSGSGMTAAVARQIFEPFFTTKDPGKGRGLGLAVCQRIVEDAGGRIEVSSADEGGSEFRVSLPVAEERT
ncbi:MAG: two-component sensor histidine kinase [Desulfuromonas sp.]|nr:MAG: two-component sensor histidine kinase [Desulfuromonas sp.]